MSIFDKLPRRFKNRIRLVFAAIFSKSSDLDATMISTSKAYEYLDTTPPNVVLRGWGNPYDVLPGFLHQHDSLDDETIQLTDKKKHPESSEEDVLRFLYNITCQTKSKTIIEVGVFHGAASLSMAQGIDENGGGEIHLIDISEEFLQDVFAKISQKGWKVTTHKHHIKINKETEWDKLVTTGVTGLPKADIIFIDGGHSYKEVKNDVSQYQPLVSPGGFLILHDTIQHDGPRRVVSEMFDKGVKFCSLETSHGCGLTIIRC
jgi:predicted O-methyltransferase YrrM